MSPACSTSNEGNLSILLSLETILDAGAKEAARARAAAATFLRAVVVAAVAAEAVQEPLGCVVSHPFCREPG